MTDWTLFNLNRSPHTIDFTQRALYNLDQILNRSDYDNKDAEYIFACLRDNMTIISFPYYLKRYLYLQAEIDIPFSRVEDRVYYDIVKYAFSEHHAPKDFKNPHIKWDTRVRRFFNTNTVKRETIFLLGFGLDMSEEDVSDFLTKVILEEDFNMQNPQEVIYRYCFHHHYRYLTARKLLTIYEEMTPDALYGSASCEDREKKADQADISLILQDEQSLLSHLYTLRYHTHDSESHTQKEFLALYKRARLAVSHMLTAYGESHDESDYKKLTPDMIKPADIEKILYSGIPTTNKGNLEQMSRSRLSEQFHNKRLSRQRISAILADRNKADRFDLISLLFLIYVAEGIEEDWPVDRYLRFRDEINETLTRCHLMKLYPTNPYESFILMCLLSEEPLSVYSDVFELSYQTGDI